MIVSLRLLKELIPNNYSASELSDRLTEIGIEVEGVRKIVHDFKGVVTGKILSIDKLPETQLFNVSVNTKDEDLSIITSAVSLKVGDVVPVARVGSIIVNKFVIEKKSFMSYASDGMLCSVLELGLDSDIVGTDEKEGIFVLPHDTPIGLPFEDVFPIDDELLEISLLPDRADAFYVAGLARWIEIIKAKEESRKADFSLLEPHFEIRDTFENNFTVEVKDSNLCPTYSARIIQNVKVKKSSYSFRKKLFLLRIRPINNIVDITNFVSKMHGQPLHAFDFDKLQGRIIVRSAFNGEKLRTLDGIERELNPNNLLIADLSGPIGIAGVMGGEKTAVTTQTKNIFLESAFFLPQVIAASSRSIGLVTDASTLFEKGVNRNFQTEASKIAANLMIEEAKGSVSKENLVIVPLTQKPVSVRYSRINSYLGDEISPSEVKKYFDFEGFTYFDKGDKLLVNSPAFRQDINIEEDLIEEVLRMKGYNDLEEIMLEGKVRSGRRTPFEDFTMMLKGYIAELGLMEVNTVSLVSAAMLRQTETLNESNIVTLLNPLSEDMNILRPCLLPTLYQVLKRNLNVGRENIGIFEIGKVFEKATEIYTESTELSILLKGERIDENGFKMHLAYDFFYLKGLLENIFERLNILVNYKRKEYPFLHPFQSAAIIINDNEIGFLGRLSKGLDKDAYFASINVDSLSKLSKKVVKFDEYSVFPSVKRDIAVIVDDDIEEIEVRDAIMAANIEELKDIKIFDVYKGLPLPPNKKNLAYSLEFSSNERTFKSEEIDDFISKIECSIGERVKGELRKK